MNAAASDRAASCTVGDSLIGVSAGLSRISDRFIGGVVDAKESFTLARIVALSSANKNSQ